MERYDIVVAGGGLAGLTAGLFGARHSHRTLVLVAGAPGGQLVSVDRIEDFPGFPEGVAGYELCPLAQEQAASQGAAFQLAEATGLTADSDGWRVASSGDDYHARAVIIATGAQPRPLGLPGEERLHGRGISHCASCDGPLLRGQVAAVVGGGDWALQEALTLADHAARVILVHQAPAFSAQQTYQLRVLNHPIIEVRHHTTVEAVLGETSLARIQLRDGATGTTEDLPVAGLFVYTGVQPNTGWLADHLPLTDSGHIQTDGLMRTVQPGLLAAGDVRQHAVGYALTAAADGATAAIAAHQYLVDGAWPAA